MKNTFVTPHLEAQAAVSPSICSVASMLPNIWLIPRTVFRELSCFRTNCSVTLHKYAIFWWSKVLPSDGLFTSGIKSAYDRNLWMDGAESRHWNNRAHNKHQQTTKNEPLEINREQVLKLVTQGCNFAHEQRKKKKTILHNFKFCHILLFIFYYFHHDSLNMLRINCAILAWRTLTGAIITQFKVSISRKVTGGVVASLWFTYYELQFSR